MSRVAAWPPRLLLAGVALLGVGMVLVASGVRVGPLFIPGVSFLGLGFLLLAGAGIIASLPERADDG